MAKRVATIFLVIVLLLGLLAAGALLFVTSEPGSRWISQKLHDGLKRQTGLAVSFRKIDLAFFPPRLLLEDLQVSGLDVNLGCTIEEAEVSPSALDLLAGRIRIEEIYMGAPRCKVALSTSDMNRFRQASKIGDDASEQIDLSFLPGFDVVALSGGHFEFTVDDPKGVGNLNFSLSGLHLDITGRHRGQDQIEIRILLERASANYSRNDMRIDEQMSGLKLRAALDERSVNIRSLQGKIAEVKLAAEDVFIPVSLEGNHINATSFSINVPLERLSRFPLGTPPMAGQAGFRGQIGVGFPKGAAPAVTARGQVSLRNVAVGDFVVGDLDGKVSYTERGIAYSDVELRTAGGALRLSGEVALDSDLSISSDVVLADIELAKLLENLTVGNSFVMQQVSGKVKLTGKLNGLRLRGTTSLTVKNHKVFDNGFRTSDKHTILSIPEVSVQGPIVITEKSLVATGLSVRRNDSLVNVDMEFFFNGQKGWNLHARSNRMNLRDVREVAGFAVDGQGSLECKIDAPGYGAPFIDGSVNFSNMMFWGYDYGTVSSKVRLDGTKLYFENLDVRSRKSHYRTDQLTLDFASKAGFQVGATFHADRVELDDLARSHHVDTTGWGSPRGFVSGEVDIQYQTRPENLRVTANLAHEGITLFNEVFGKGGLEALYDEGTLTVNRLDLAKGPGVVSLTGTMNAAAELNMMGEVKNVQVEDIVYPLVSDLELEGTVQAYAVVEGTLAHPRGRATLRVKNMSRRHLTFGSSEIEASLENNVVTINGTLADNMATVEHCVFDLNRDTFSVEAFVTKLDVAHILGLKDNNEPIGLTATGELTVAGRLSGNPHLNGDARVYRLDASMGRFAFRNKEPFAIEVDNGRLKLAGARVLGEQMVFDVSGEADAKRFKLAARGLANLDAASQLTETVSNSSGTLAFNVMLNGPYDAPRFRGDAEVKDGQFSVEGFPDPITQVNGKVLLGSNMIRLENFSGRSAGGTLDMNGWLSLKGFVIDDYRFNLGCANLELQLMEDLTLKASTLNEGLVLSPGKVRDIPFVSGDVELSNFKYTAPVHIIEVSDLNVSGIGGKRQRTTRPRLFDKSKDVFEYDIRLHGERNLVIFNNLLDAQLKIDDKEEPLRLVGTNQNYGFLGRVIGASGEVRFAGKTFEIQNAYLSFKDVNRPENPNFRVTADVDVRDWKVTITAEGNVEEYEVRLSSQPYLSQEDIVMLLLTGMIKQEHTAMNSQGLAMSLAPILENVSSGTIPVEVNVYSEYSEKAGAETTRVALGKRISNDIWVQVSSSVGQEQDVEGTLSYKINDNVSVSASYDNKNETSKTGNLGLDLRFRLEF